MDECKKIKILFISLRSDYGGGPTHMYDLVTGLNSYFEKYVACPIQKPFYNMYEKNNIKVFPLPVRTLSLVSFVDWYDLLKETILILYILMEKVREFTVDYWVS